MKAILLGPNGQLGNDIRAVNAQMRGALSILPVDRSNLDLCDFEAVSRFFQDLKFECIINCSGFHKTDEVERSAQLAFSINAHLPCLLAEICAEKKARLVHISTDYVFGGQGKQRPLNESDCKAPINIYGASKSMGEELVLLTGGDVLILRVASLFGIAGSSGKGGNFVETVVRLAREKGVLKVVADQTMSPTATADVARSLITMLCVRVPAGIWNVVNSDAATWYDFAARIIERTKIPAQVIPIPTAEFPMIARRPQYSVLDNSKLASAIGPIRSWRDALDDYLIAKSYRTT